MAEINKLSPTHEALLRWVLQNPGPRLVSRAAEFFGYSVPWMSTVMNSDAFRAKLAELSEQADCAVVADIPAKLRGVASLALDGLAEQVHRASNDLTMQPREFLKETAEMALEKLGFGAKGAAASPTTINNTQVFVAADPGALARARERFAALGLSSPTPLPAPDLPLEVESVHTLIPADASTP